MSLDHAVLWFGRLADRGHKSRTEWRGWCFECPALEGWPFGPVLADTLDSVNPEEPADELLEMFAREWRLHAGENESPRVVIDFSGAVAAIKGETK